MFKVLKFIPAIVLVFAQIGCNKSGKSSAAPVISAPINSTALNIKNECSTIRQNLESNHYSIQKGVFLTPLMRASYSGNVKRIHAVLARGERIDMKDRYGRTALQYAVLGGHYDAFEVLFRAGANIHVQNSFKASTVHLAAAWNRTQMVKLMVTAGRLDINATSKFNGYTMLHSAAINCNLDLVQFLVQHGADVNKKSTSEKTALKEAIAANAAESIDLLLQFGADPSI